MRCIPPSLPAQDSARSACSAGSPNSAFRFDLPLPVLLGLASFSRLPRTLYKVSVCLLVPALLLLAVCYCRTPTGRALPGAGADSVFTGGVSYQRASLANLVPEIVQLKLGTLWVWKKFADEHGCGSLAFGVAVGYRQGHAGNQ
jgi:hypothetical protein